MKIADRLNHVGEYYFSSKLREIDVLNKEGKNIINLGIGSPDLPPHPDVIAELQNQAARPDTHAYQNYKGIPEFRNAIASWYEDWYGVNLDPACEILPLIGSKEGIMHICMSFINPGDVVLIPNPGYPTYRSAASIAGAEILEYSLTAENNWYPDFNSLANLVRDKKVKLLFANYPHMPTGKLPDIKVFEQLVAFAQKHDILIVHDNPYSFILNENPVSMLSVKGAIEVVLELNSLSKSHNLAGWRLGMLCGRKELIDIVVRFKSNMDSGMFLPVQLAAVKALSLGKEWFESLNAVYKRRKQLVEQILQSLGCKYASEQAGLFVWAKCSDRYADGYALSDEILYGAKVFLTPGGIFGSEGNRYIRLSLCASEENLENAANRIRNYLELNGAIAAK